MKKTQLKPMPLLFTLINLFLGVMLLWTTILIITYIAKFFQEAKGFLYVKDFNDYIHNIKDNINAHKWNKEELELFVKTFNNEYGSDVLKLNITTGDHADIIKNTKDLANQLKGLFGSNHDNSKAVQALINTSKNQTLSFLAASANWRVEAFVKSALAFAKHVDFEIIMEDIKNNDVTNTRVISYVLHGMGSWFTDINKEASRIIFLFIICWGFAILFSIFQKMIRSSYNLKGGTWAIIWAIFTPALGFIVYPGLTLTYLFRNKSKKAL